jgi:hypothetical protein
MGRNSSDYHMTKFGHIIAWAITLPLFVLLFMLIFFVLNVYTWIVFEPFGFYANNV